MAVTNVISDIALEEAMSETPVRFAVASFEGWDSARRALSELYVRGFDVETVTFLGIGGALIKHSPAVTKLPNTLVELAFKEAGEPVFCSAGILSDGLMEGAKNGAARLGKALGRWLLPRHAARIAEAVARSQIVLWIQILNPQAERDACECLLWHSSTPVDVHDLLPAKPRSGNGQSGGS